MSLGTVSQEDFNRAKVAAQIPFSTVSLFSSQFQHLPNHEQKRLATTLFRHAVIYSKDYSYAKLFSVMLDSMEDETANIVLPPMIRDGIEQGRQRPVYDDFKKIDLNASRPLCLLTIPQRAEALKLVGRMIHRVGSSTPAPALTPLVDIVTHAMDEWPLDFATCPHPSQIKKEQMVKQTKFLQKMAMIALTNAGEKWPDSVTTSLQCALQNHTTLRKDHGLETLKANFLEAHKAKPVRSFDSPPMTFRPSFERRASL